MDEHIIQSTVPSWESALSSRSDLAQYQDNSLALFALCLQFRIDDIQSVAAESITDGSDDKGCDLVYVEKEEGLAVIAQCYQSRKPRESAPSHKASALNTAVGWMLQRPIEELPPRLQSSARELRSAISEGLVTKLHIWYVHNLPECKNVKDELTTVEATVHASLNNNFPGRKIIIQAQEIGKETFEVLYANNYSTIMVCDEFKIPVENAFELRGTNWEALVTAIPAKFLHRVYRKYKTKLFSANVRDYLGSRKSDSNINNGIKLSAEDAPGDFWVFNNGLTILVNEFDYVVVSKNRHLKIKGLSIVNGAQTTGAIGSLRKSPDDSARVPVRFVKTSDTALISNIIQYNNSQNKITASDFRSTDHVQKRLSSEVEDIPSAVYQGGRRGGHIDSISRDKRIMPSYTIGQALAAFHQDPVTAYNKKAEIWVSDTLYSKYFHSHTTGQHLVFAYSLLRAVEEKKTTLVEKSKKAGENLTDIENRQLQYFRNRGSTYLLTSAIAKCVETFLKRPIPSTFRLSFGDKISPDMARSIWKDIVEVVSQFCPQLEDAFTDGLKNTEKVQNVTQILQSLVQATSESNAVKYDNFARQVVIKPR